MKTVHEGKCLWWDRRDGHGVVVTANGDEHYADVSTLQGLNYLDAGDPVVFKARYLGGTLCAYDVEAPEGVHLAPCEASDCQECCPHDERDHGICLDCGHEEDPGAAIDRAMDSLEDR